MHAVLAGECLPVPPAGCGSTASQQGVTCMRQKAMLMSPFCTVVAVSSALDALATVQDNTLRRSSAFPSCILYCEGTSNLHPLSSTACSRAICSAWPTATF